MKKSQKISRLYSSASFDQLLDVFKSKFDAINWDIDVEDISQQHPSPVTFPTLLLGLLAIKTDLFFFLTNDCVTSLRTLLSSSKHPISKLPRFQGT
tara:strand:- start:184 stop:471 length:288 start_codon:yes stop_codon:yes gene_type:complete